MKKQAAQDLLQKGGMPRFISYHKSQGNYEIKDGTKFRLTVQGWNKFNGRLNGKEAGQQVSQDQVDNFIKAFTKGDFKGTYFEGQRKQDIKVYL